MYCLAQNVAPVIEIVTATARAIIKLIAFKLALKFPIAINKNTPEATIHHVEPLLLAFHIE